MPKMSLRNLWSSSSKEAESLGGKANGAKETVPNVAPDAARARAEPLGYISRGQDATIAVTDLDDSHKRPPSCAACRVPCPQAPRHHQVGGRAILRPDHHEHCGHVSRQMLEHYSHIRMAAKRATLDAISTRTPEASAYGKAPVFEREVHPKVHQIEEGENRDAVKLLNDWWTWGGSNSRPPGCKPGALPAELQARKITDSV